MRVASKRLAQNFRNLISKQDFELACRSKTDLPKSQITFVDGDDILEGRSGPEGFAGDVCMPPT